MANSLPSANDIYMKYALDIDPKFYHNDHNSPANFVIKNVHLSMSFHINKVIKSADKV
jgi:hypothetical protein